jgi:quercetin dioxygenase-like cupin family protein
MSNPVETPRAGLEAESDAMRVIGKDEWGPTLPVIRGVGSCREIVGSRVDCDLRSLYHFELESLSQTIEFNHPGEAVYYVHGGGVEVNVGTEPAFPVTSGGMFHIQPETRYSFSTVGGAVVVGGPAPVDPAFGAEVTEIASKGTASAYHIDEPGLLVPFISADARLVVWYGVGAVSANMNYVVLEPGERNREHVHDYSEDTIFILDGHGTAEDITNGKKWPIGPGDAVTIPPGVWHAVAADRGERLVSVGGPCPADLDMLAAVGVDVDALTAQLPRS